MSGVEGSIATVRRRLNERHEADIAEMARLDRLIERHKRKRDSIRPPYAGAMLEEVFREIVSHTPGRSFRVMGPFGLGSEYGVSVEEDGAHLAHFTFRSPRARTPVWSTRPSTPVGSRRTRSDGRTACIIRRRTCRRTSPRGSP